MAEFKQDGFNDILNTTNFELTNNPSQRPRPDQLPSEPTYHLTQEQKDHRNQANSTLANLSMEMINYYPKFYTEDFCQRFWTEIGEGNFNPIGFVRKLSEEIIADSPRLPGQNNITDDKILGRVGKYINDVEQNCKNGEVQYLTSFLIWFFQRERNLKAEVHLRTISCKGERKRIKGGRCDAVEFLPNREIVIYEFKSGSRDSFNSDQEKHPKQLKAYMELYRLHAPHLESITGQLIYFTGNPNHPVDIETFIYQQDGSIKSEREDPPQNDGRLFLQWQDHRKRGQRGKKSSAPSGRQKRKPRQYACEGGEKDPRPSSHLEPKQSTSYLIDFLFNNAGTILEEHREEFQQILTDEEPDILGIIKKIEDHIYITPPIIGNLEAEELNYINKAKRFLSPQYPEFQRMVCNALRWFYSLSEYEDIKFDVRLDGFGDITYGYCDALIYRKDGIEIVEFKLGDKNDYTPTARDTHINQIRTYREMLLREIQGNPHDIHMSLVYFSSKENKPEVLKIVPLI